MRYIIILCSLALFPNSVSADECLVVNGYNLCEDAKIIAKNEAKQLGQRIPGAEYVLQKVYPEKMTVIYEYKSIYTKQKLTQLIGKGSLVERKKKSFRDACRHFTVRDPFVKDGGVFVMKYFYNDGGLIQTNTISLKNCN